MLKKNIFSFLVALVILYLSLANSRSFDKVPLFEIPFLDKIVHFAMYWVLMLVIIFENRKSIKSNQQLIFISTIPLIYGIVIEILQALLTSTRSGSILDALADAAGIFVGVLIGSVYLRKRKSDIY